MLSRIPQLIALIASPAVAFALEPASSVSSVDETRMSSITDTAPVGAQSLPPCTRLK